MTYLLDTHAYLWTIMGSPRLSPAALAAITDPSNELYLSVGSLWESAIKIAKGTLAVPGETVEFLVDGMVRYQVKQLDIARSHLIALQHLPPLHRDPFDRLLVAQARTEGMTLMSIDASIRQYDVATLW